MSLEVRYEAGVAATYEDITDRVRVGSLDVTQNAEEGSVAMSTITIDDPDGDYEIKGYRRIAVYETDGTAGVDELTYNGFIVDRKIIRGPYRTGPGRQWVCSVVDTNCLLEFRIMTGEDAERPAETDIERLDWLLAESEMNRIPNHDFYNTSGPVNMDATDYRGQRAVDVINDCAQQSGKNYFAFCTDDTPSPIPDAPGKTTFWYDWADSAEYPSVIKLSNDLDDILANPAETFEISADTEFVRDPARVYAEAYVRYDGGEWVEFDVGISNEFTYRSAVVPAENVKTAAQAEARALRYLNDMQYEEDRITTAVLLPAAKVNWVREGMRIRFKATHLPPEYRDFVSLRVLQRKVKQVTEEFYLVTLTLAWGPSPPAGCSIMAKDHVSNDFDIPVGPTPAGFHPVNSTYGTFGDFVAGGPLGNVFYNTVIPTRPIPNAPADGSVGGWPFSIHGASAPTMPGGIGDGSGLSDTFQIIVVGPGHLTIWADDTGSGAADAELFSVTTPVPSDESFDVQTSVESKALTFPTTEFDIPDDGECLHIVEVGWTGGSYLYGGFTWSPG